MRVPLLLAPFNESVSAVPSVKPATSRKALVATVVPAAVVPSGVFVALPVAPSLIVPTLIVVVPAYEFDPERVNVPEPDFVKPPEPLMTPENVLVPSHELVIKFPPLSIVPEILSVPPEVVVIVGAAVENVMFKLIVIVKLVLFAVIAEAPPVNVIALPASVYAPAPESKVMEAKLPEEISLLVDN